MSKAEKPVDVVEFTIPGRAPQAMSPNGRASYWLKHRDGKAYGETVFLIAMSASGPSRRYPWQRAHMTVTQRAVRLRDHDNFAASFKPGQDACVRAGIIADDAPTVLDVTYRAEKCGKVADEAVLVRIERLEARA